MLDGTAVSAHIRFQQFTIALINIPGLQPTVPTSLEAMDVTDAATQPAPSGAVSKTSDSMETELSVSTAVCLSFYIRSSLFLSSSGSHRLRHRRKEPQSRPGLSPLCHASGRGSERSPCLWDDRLKRSLTLNTF
jgi:hypothetical protein